MKTLGILFKGFHIEDRQKIALKALALGQHSGCFFSCLISNMTPQDTKTRKKSKYGGGSILTMLENRRVAKGVCFQILHFLILQTAS
jgi:hypothetical protein